MKYELAKELKDAGFPQNIGNYQYDSFIGPDEYILKFRFELTRFHTKYVFSPTLEELIDACGESLGDLTRAGRAWMTNYDNVGNYPQSEGDTPAEAVARLWLELNKK